jgi:hypothetical protein
MQIKNPREFTLMDSLEAALAEIPFSKRSRVAIEFRASQQILNHMLESIYIWGTQRMLHLSYYLEWSRTLENNKGLIPAPPQEGTSDYMFNTFHDFRTLTEKEFKYYNSSFTFWINNQVVRELNEFLNHYLIELFEACTATEHLSTPVTPKEISEIRKICRTFELNGFADRLKVLRQKFGFKLTHNQELLSLYQLRNVFAHFDGVVEKKLCKKKEYLEVLWPVSEYKLKKRGKDEWIPYHKAQQPISEEQYETIEASWFTKRDIRKFRVHEAIVLSYQDLHTLIFFYHYVFNELQKALLDYLKKQGFEVPPFEDYRVQFGYYVSVPEKQRKSH